MHQRNILEFESMPEFGELDFPNLKKFLEESLFQIQNLPDLEKIIKAMNPLLKDEKFNAEEQLELKRLRQRAYDRRRSSKFEEIVPNILPKNLEKTQIPKIQKNPNQKKLTLVQQKPLFETPNHQIISTNKEETMKTCSQSQIVSVLTPKNENLSDASMTFWNGIVHALTKLDGESFAQKAPKILAFGFGAALVSWFVWAQSVDLYKSAGFNNPELTAAGALLMVIGFAAYHTLKRSFLALLLCLYAGGYEGYFMISGTVNDEKVTQTAKVNTNPELIFQKEKLQQGYDNYLNLKNRYEDLKSDVYQNPWFKKKHLDPAWVEVEDENHLERS